MLSVNSNDLESIPPVRPPVPLLVLAGAAVALGLGLYFLGSLAANVVGYLLCSVVAIGFVALFRRNDLRRRCSPYYSQNASLGAMTAVIIFSGILVASLNIWPIATELAT